MNPLLAALVSAGIITPDDAARINRSLDPDAARAWAEQQIAIAVQGGLSQQQARLVELVRRGNPTPAALDAFWAGEDARLWASVRATFEDVAAENAIAMAVRLGADDAMWNAVNQAVIDWTHRYYTGESPDFVGSVRSLNQTARLQVGEAYARWQRGELIEGRGGLPALIAELEPTFGPERATRIAATEATRIAAESTNAAAMATPDIEVLEWGTAFDEVVCPICSPLNGRQVDKGRPFAPGVMLPPAHVNCRCWVTPLTRPVAQEVN